VVGAVIPLADDERHYLLQVMRRRVGDPVEVLAFDGRVFLAEVVSTDGVRIVAEGERPWQPVRAITLVQALLKGDHFSDVVDRATQAGVSRFVPLITDRTIVREVKSTRLDRWRTIAKEASEQCRRGDVPTISDPIALKDLYPEKDADAVVLHPGGPGGAPWNTPTHKPLTLVVGPEGGLSDDEVAALTSRGFEPLSLEGPVYRAENAGAFAAVLFLH
jgi:16S rRNA (uracil1498-N3)-methyltransferase